MYILGKIFLYKIVHFYFTTNKDQERFYYNSFFYSLEDLINRGAEWRKEYNNFPMRSLGWLSLNEFIKK